MKASVHVLALAGCAAVAAWIPSANAGQCASEIETLDRKTIVGGDAGYGLTTGATGAQPTAKTATPQNPSGAASSDPPSAEAKLEQARDLDRQGKEAECLAALAEAKRLAGEK